MAPALEPAFTPGRPVWPLAGMALAEFEPDDPDLAIPHGALQKGTREAPERHVFTDRDSRFTHTATEPLGPVPARSTGLRRKWTLALAASCVFHVAIAAFFLLTPEEPVLMEGVTSSGAASLGDAALDQTEAGDPNAENAVDVTMITVLDAVPVKVEAETVPTEKAAEQVEVAEAVTTERETVQPVEEPPLEAVEPTNAEAVKPVERIEQAPAERQTPVKAEAAPAPTISETVPQVLATDRAELVNDDNVVQKPAPVQAEKPVEATEAVEPVQASEAAMVEQAETVATESPKAAAQEKPVETEKAEAVEIARAEPGQAAPVETVKPVAEPKPQAEPKPEARQTEEKPTPTRTADEAEKKPEKAAAKPKKAEDGKKLAEKADAKPKKSGNAGSNQASARRGSSDGQENGDNRQASRGGSKNGEIGNAAVSNYPGKVRSKLVRAARSVRAKGSGEVVVAFAVSSNGGVRSARVARSSGDASVDQAALQAVRKASPFPPIPAGAGRSSWEFSIPLAFRR